MSFCLHIHFLVTNYLSTLEDCAENLNIYCKKQKIIEVMFSVSIFYVTNLNYAQVDLVHIYFGTLANVTFCLTRLL